MSDGQQFESSPEEVQPAQTSAWQLLRTEREARGLSIAEVAQHLKLTPRQVEAMEAGDLAHLPGPAFARGFVRNYARFLHIDPAHFNSVLDVVREAPQPMNALPLGQMPGPSSWRFSSLPALGIAAALLALAVAGWHYRWFEPRDEQYLADVMNQSGVPAEGAGSAPQASAPVTAQGEQSAPSAPVMDIVAASAVVVEPAASAPVAASAPAVASSAPVAVASASSAPAAAAAQSAPRVASSAAASAASSRATSSAAASQIAVPAVPKAASAPSAQSSVISGPVPQGSRRLHFAFDADAWVEVRDAHDKVVFSRLNAAGSQQDVQGEAPLKVIVGNAPQVRLTVDGKNVDLASKTSSNVARISLP